MTQSKGFSVAAVASLALAATPAPEAWSVDAGHSEIGFEVRHFFTPVTGKFDAYDIELSFDADSPENSSVSARIQVASINTNNADRDDHLRTADFFGAETFPEIRFQSKSVRARSENEFVATGDLTIKGVTKSVDLPITLLGVQEVPADMREMIGAAQVASFRAEFTIDRGVFGVGTGGWAETAIIGGEVKVRLLLEAHQ